MIESRTQGTVASCCAMLLAASGCADPNSASLDPPPLMNFVYPVNGVLNQDIFHVFYVGHIDAGGLIHDYDCGIKVNGFTGSEIMAPYYSYLDSNVVVVAAAAGTVTEMHDGDQDLRTGGERGPIGLGNFVRLEHREGMETIYAQLKQGSVGVTVGQVVETGDPLGAMGASGNALLPSLQFEVVWRGEFVDPFEGPCGPNFTQWASPIPYQDQSVHIGSGIATGTPSLTELKEPIPTVDTVTTSDGAMTFWVMGTNRVQGTLWQFVLIGPDGVTTTTQGTTPSTLNIWFAWESEDIPMSWPAGTGRWEYYEGTDLVAQRSFEFVPSPQPEDAPVSGDGQVRTGVSHWGISER